MDNIHETNHMQSRVININEQSRENVIPLGVRFIFLNDIADFIRNFL